MGKRMEENSVKTQDYLKNGIFNAQRTNLSRVNKFRKFTKESLKTCASLCSKIILELLRAFPNLFQTIAGKERRVVF